MALTDRDLVILMLAVIDEYGENMNLIIHNIRKIHDQLEDDPHVRLGINPMPDDVMIITGLVGEKQIAEWARIDKMVNTDLVGKA